VTNLNSGFFAFLGVKLKQKLNEDAYLSHLNIFSFIKVMKLPIITFQLVALLRKTVVIS